MFLPRFVRALWHRVKSGPVLPSSQRSGYRYDAFMSYSHKSDREFAPALQWSLQQFARPWRALRAVSIFRDQTDLSANSDLWDTIAAAVRQSSAFIFLASPAAADSKWARREIETFMEREDASRFYIVLTEGVLKWDDAAKDFDWDETTAFPRLGRRIFAEQPLWVDVTWTRKAPLSTRDPQFVDGLATISSAMRGLSKSELYGRDVAEHRKAKLFRWTAFTGLVLLAAGLAGASFLAVRGRNDARLRLARSQVANGVAAMDAGDLTAALPWFVAALQTEERIPDRVAMHRLRITDLLERQPVPVYAWFRDRPVLHAALTADGRAVLIASGDEADTDQGTYSCRETPRPGCQGTLQFHDLRTGAPDGREFRFPGILAAAPAPRGRVAAVLTLDGVLRMLDATSGRQLWARAWLNEPNSGQLQFSRSGQQLLSVADSSVRLWDVAAGTSVQAPTRGYVYAARFHPQDASVVIAEESAISLWNPRTGGMRRLSFPQISEITDFDLAPDGNRIALAGNMERPYSPVERSGASNRYVVMIAPLDGTGGPQAVLDHDKPVSGVRFDGAGLNIATRSGNVAEGGSFDGGSRLWEAETGTALTDWIRAAQATSAIEFSPDGRRVLIGGDDGTVSIWSVPEARGDVKPRIEFLLHHGSLVSHASFGADGRTVLVAGGAGVIRLWELPQVSGDSVVWARYAGVLPGLEQQPDSAVVFDDTLIWRVDEQRRPVGEPLRPGGFVRSIGSSADGRLVATGTTEGSVMIWDIVKWRAELQVPLGHGGSVTSLTFSPDGRKLATSSADNTARIWDVRTGTPLTPPLSHGPNVGGEGLASVTFSADGTRIISENAFSVRVWDAATGEPVTPLVTKASSWDTGKAEPIQPALTRWWKDPAGWSVEDLLVFSEVVSSRRIDQSGGIVALDPASFRARWQSVSATSLRAAPPPPR